MDLAPDPIFLQVREALRSALAAIPVRPGVHGAPVTDGGAGPARTVLDQLDAAAYELPADAGGLGLGLTAGALVSGELGRAACGNPYRARALAADVSWPHPEGVGLAGLEAPPPSGARGVSATARAGGWELTGTATVDDAEAAVFLVAVVFAEPALVAVPRTAPGVSVLTASFPPAVRFEATPIASTEVVATGDTLADALARARVRQAAYLLGIAEGAHRIALDYTGSRRQFGSRLRDLPAVSFPLARGLVALRATRASVYRAAWLIDTEPIDNELPGAGTEPIAALAMAAETARDVVRLSMQSCGVRAMTAELGLHRYFRLAAAESARYGDPAALWRVVGAERLRSAAAERELVAV